MAMQDPQTVAQRWASRMGQSSQKITDGVNAVTTSPTAAAAQHLDKYLASVTDAVQSGRMAQRLNSVSLSAWQQATIAKVSRIGPGATAAVGKMANFLSQWLPHVATVRSTVRAMPSSTFQDRLSRMTRNAELLHEFRRR